MRTPASPVLILGARSDIGRAIARAYASCGCSVILGARRADELEADRRDLEIRFGTEVSCIEFDVTGSDPDSFFRSLGTKPGTVIMVAGLLGDQPQSAARDDAAELVMATNYTGPARFLLAAARVIEPGAGKAIIGISSVAGDRGRGSNFVYGSAKAGFTAFLSGLRNSLAGTGMHVITIKPGYVDTRMNAGMRLPKLITAQPEEVAQAILKAQQQASNIIYVRSVWRLIMAVVRLIPERIFKRLKF